MNPGGCPRSMRGARPAPGNGPGVVIGNRRAGGRIGEGMSSMDDETRLVTQSDPAAPTTGFTVTPGALLSHTYRIDKLLARGGYFLGAQGRAVGNFLSLLVGRTVTDDGFATNQAGFARDAAGRNDRL